MLAGGSTRYAEGGSSSLAVVVPSVEIHLDDLTDDDVHDSASSGRTTGTTAVHEHLVRSPPGRREVLRPLVGGKFDQKLVPVQGDALSIGAQGLRVRSRSVAHGLSVQQDKTNMAEKHTTKTRGCGDFFAHQFHSHKEGDAKGCFAAKADVVDGAEGHGGHVGHGYFPGLVKKIHNKYFQYFLLTLLLMDVVCVISELFIDKHLCDLNLADVICEANATNSIYMERHPTERYGAILLEEIKTTYKPNYEWGGTGEWKGRCHPRYISRLHDAAAAHDTHATHGDTNATHGATHGATTNATGAHSDPAHAVGGHRQLHSNGAGGEGLSGGGGLSVGGLYESLRGAVRGSIRYAKKREFPMSPVTFAKQATRMLSSEASSDAAAGGHGSAHSGGPTGHEKVRVGMYLLFDHISPAHSFCKPCAHLTHTRCLFVRHALP